ncbi:MAG: HEAT repeat protein [Planctomycetota bacterium]|jgi:HEAT repeat protein
MSGEQTASTGKGPAIAGVLVLVLGAAGLYSRMSGSSEVIELTLDQRYAQDRRLTPLLYDCQFGRTFDADTSDLLPVMISKLNLGQRGPLRSFKEELAAIGAPAIPGLTRLFAEAYGDKWRSGVVENVLSVCSLMSTNAGLDIARSAFDHPKNSIRLGALDTLVKHGELEDYDRIKPWLERVTAENELVDYLHALLAVDGPRFYRDWLGMMRAGQFEPVWLQVVTRLHGVYDPEIVAGMAEFAMGEGMNGAVIPFLLGPAARDGDIVARAFLVDRLRSEVPTRVQYTLEALRRVGLGEDAGPVLVHSDVTALRKLAAEILSESEPTQAVHDFLDQGLSDPDPNVRGVCLTGLIRMGDELSESQAIALLGGTKVERRRGIDALSGAVAQTPFSAADGGERVSSDLALPEVPLGAEEGLDLDEVAEMLQSGLGWAGDQALALRAQDVLIAEYGQSPGRSERISILKALGRVPLADSAEFVLNAAEDLGASVGSHHPLRWCAGQVFNSGSAGQALLRARLLVETRPFRRMDLLAFIWQDRSEASVEIMVGILEDPSSEPFEKLYVADRLTRMRASGRVAGAIKRAYLACTHAQVRPALQCLLWTWYGQHNA